MQTIHSIRRVTNPNGITGRNPEDQDRLVFIPHNCPILVLKEMGSMCKIAVRIKNTKEIIELFVQYRIVFMFTKVMEAA